MKKHTKTPDQEKEEVMKSLKSQLKELDSLQKRYDKMRKNGGHKIDFFESNEKGST